MSSFAQLMALSKAKTDAQNAEVQAAIHKREEKAKAAKEAAERKAREEKEKQEKLRLVQAEQERREKEKQQQRELAAQAKAEEAERKQQEQMNKILGKSRHEVFEKRDKEGMANGFRKRKAASDDEEGYSGSTLTRAEKRALKMDPDARPAWAQKLVGNARPVGESRPSGPSTSHSPSKRRTDHKQAIYGKSLNAPSNLGAQGDQSLPIKERLKQSDYFVPIKLSGPKDRRTQADYFQEKRKKALEAGRSDSPGDFSGRGSGSDSKGKPSARPGLPSKSSINGIPKSASTSRLNVASSRMESPPARKRRRSESLSSSDLDSDYSRKRPKQNSALSSTIWQMITGKDRSHYADDVFSDEDEDMEVSAAEVAREERRALKAAQQEDQEALEAEMRHDEEKKRKRLAKEKGTVGR